MRLTRKIDVSSWMMTVFLIVTICCYDLSIAQSSTSGVSCNSSNFGQTFYAAFMQATTSTSLNLQIFSEPANSAASVTATVQTPNNLQIITIPANGSAITFPNSVQMNGSSTINAGIKITASANIVVVLFTEQMGFSSAATLVLPDTALGQIYYAVTYAPTTGVGAPAGGSYAEIVIVARSSGTSVNVTFPTFMTGSVMYGGNTYTNGTTLMLTMNALQVTQIQATVDLTGALITASVNVAVFSGNIGASLNGGGVGNAMQQLLPVYTLLNAAAPNVYIVQPMPDKGLYQVKIIATAANTQINYTINGLLAPTLAARSLNSSGSTTSFTNSSQTVIIYSNQPIVVMQLATIQPTMMIIPSSIQLNSYRFIVPFQTDSLYSIYIVAIVGSSDIISLLLDGSPLNKSISWGLIQGTTPPLGTSVIPLSALPTGGTGLHTFADLNASVPISLYVYGSSAIGMSTGFAFSYPAEMCFDALQFVSVASSATSLTSSLGTTSSSNTLSSNAITFPSSSTSSLAASSLIGTATTTTTGISTTSMTSVGLLSTRPMTPVPSSTTSVSSTSISRPVTPAILTTMLSSTSLMQSSTILTSSFSGAPSSTSPAASIISSSFGVPTNRISSSSSPTALPASSAAASAVVSVAGSSAVSAAPTRVSSPSISGQSYSTFASSIAGPAASSAPPSSGITMLVSNSVSSSVSASMPVSALSSNGASGSLAPSIPPSPVSALPSSSIIGSVYTSALPSAPISGISYSSVSGSLAPFIPSSAPVSAMLSNSIPSSIISLMSSPTAASALSSNTISRTFPSSAVYSTPISSAASIGISGSLVSTFPSSIAASALPSSGISTSTTAFTNSIAPSFAPSSALTANALVSSQAPSLYTSMSSNAIFSFPSSYTSPSSGIIQSSSIPNSVISSNSISNLISPTAAAAATTAPSSGFSSLDQSSAAISALSSNGIPSSLSSFLGASSLGAPVSTAISASISSVASTSAITGSVSAVSSATTTLPSSFSFSTGASAPPGSGSSSAGMSSSATTTQVSFPFTYSLPVQIATASNQAVLLQIANPGSSPVTVVITFLGVSSTVVVANAYSNLYPRPITFSSGLQTVSIMISSSAPIVVSSVLIGSCSAFFVLPTFPQSTSFQVITWAPNSLTGGSSVFSISVGAGSAAGVQIQFPQSTGGNSCTIQVAFLTFLCGDVITLQLPASSSTTFHSSTDLSGTFISSNSSINVVAGNTGITIGVTGTPSDTTMSELFPVAAWGQAFAVAPIPSNAADGYILKISSGQGTATVSITSSGSSSAQLFIVQPGTAVTLPYSSNQPLYITSNTPVQVVQFVAGASVSSDTGAPSALFITPVSLYTNSYSYFNWYGSAGFTHYVTAILDSSIINTGVGPTVEGVTTTGIGWASIPGTTLQWKTFQILQNYSTITHPTANFGAFRYSYVKGDAVFGTCALAYTAGANFNSLQISATSATSTLQTSQVTASQMTTNGLTSSFISTTGRPSTTLPLITDCSCLNVSSSVQPSYNGQYYMQGQVYNGDPVYTRLDCPLSLFLYEDMNYNIEYYLIGPTVGLNVGDIFNNVQFITGPQGTIGWLTYSSSQFVSDPSVQLTCSCSGGQTCQYGEFINSGSSPSSIFGGVFSWTGSTYNGRPTYIIDWGGLYLYYQKSTSPVCEYWVVSASPPSSTLTQGFSTGLLYAYNPTTSLQQINTWTRSAATGSSTVTGIQFVCYILPGQLS